MTESAPPLHQPPAASGQRVIWQIAGPDAASFLQGLVSNDVLPLTKAPGLIWTALLNPQGKYLADFFLLRRAEGPSDVILLDIDTRLAASTLRLLTLYKLRAAVVLSQTALMVSTGLGTPPPGALADPRHPALGWRLYHSAADAPTAADIVDWDALRVELLVPAYPQELRTGESYLLEQGFERLHGVDFRKGCYVGQEVTARMKHKTELKKGLVRLKIAGEAPAGSPITLADGREAGILGTVSQGRALAYLRHDRLAGPLFAAGAQLWAEPS